MCVFHICFVFFFKQKTAYEMRISDWSSDVCSSDLNARVAAEAGRHEQAQALSPAWPRCTCQPAANCERDRLNQRHHSGMGPAPPNCGIDQEWLVFRDLRFGPLWQRRAEIGRASCRERVCQYV